MYELQLHALKYHASVIMDDMHRQPWHFHCEYGRSGTSRQAMHCSCTGLQKSLRSSCSAAGAAQGCGHWWRGAAQHGVQQRGARVLGEAVQLL